MAPPLVNRSTGDIIPADDHNDVKEYIEDATYRVNTQYLQVGGSTVIDNNHNGLFSGSLVAGDWSDVDISTSQITSGTFADARVAESNVTQHEGAINHNNLTNSHNLTTDIDHDQLANFVSNEHIDWTNTSNDLNTTGSVVATYGSFNNINLSNYLPQGVLPTGSIPDLESSYIVQGILPTGSIPDLEGTYIIQGVLPVGSIPTITTSKVSDFDTEVSNNTDVSANTTHRTSDGTDHTYINQDVRTSASPSFVNGSFTGSVEMNEVSITQGQKFYLNGAAGDTYFSFDGTNVDLYVNGVLKQRWR